MSMDCIEKTARVADSLSPHSFPRLERCVDPHPTADVQPRDVLEIQPPPLHARLSDPPNCSSDLAIRKVYTVANLSEEILDEAQIETSRRWLTYNGTRSNRNEGSLCTFSLSAPETSVDHPRRSALLLRTARGSRSPTCRHPAPGPAPSSGIRFITRRRSCWRNWVGNRQTSPRDNSRPESLQVPTSFSP